MTRLTLACLLALMSCDGDRDRPVPAPHTTVAASATAAPTTTATKRAAPKAAAVPTIASMQLSDATKLRFKATTQGAAPLRVTLAGREQPNPHRQALAYYRLARALGVEVVPTTHHVALPLRALRQLVTKEPAALDLLRREAVINNDGTVTALLEQRIAGVAAGPNDGQVAHWAAVAATLDPIASGEGTLVRDYVTIIALDFLAANVLRQSVLVDEQSKRVYASDNGDAFPGAVSPAALDLVLDRLKPLKRFPRGLRQGLRSFDDDAARATLAAKQQEDQLFGPRQLADLQDRRSTLLSLLESCVLKYGEGRALSL
jgi:hypothetical protein